MSCCNGNLDSSQENYIRKDGKVAFDSSQSMGGNRLIDVGNAQNDGDAINYGQLTQSLTQVRGIGASYIAAIPISAFTVISIGLDGLVYPANSSDQTFMNTVIGIALESSSENTAIKVLQVGQVSNLTNLLTGRPYFFDSNGQLTTTAPTTGFSQVVGIAKSPTEFLFDLQIPVGN